MNLNYITTLFIIFLLLLSCGRNSRKTSLLQCEISWNDRTNYQKLIGCWCNDPFFPSHSSRSPRTIKAEKTWQEICFYSDNTIDFFGITRIAGMDSRSLIWSAKNATISTGMISYEYTTKDYIKFNADKKPHPISISKNKIDGLSFGPYYLNCK